MKVVNQVVKEMHGNCLFFCVHRREVPSLADAAWIQFACENPTDPTVLNALRTDTNPGLRQIVFEYQKQKAATAHISETAPANPEILTREKSGTAHE